MVFEASPARLSGSFPEEDRILEIQGVTPHPLSKRSQVPARFIFR
jgi:hypothetical protein